MLDGLGLSNQPDYRTLVHFPGNPLYYLDINAGDYLTVYGQLTFRLRYFAKKANPTILSGGMVVWI
uniref:YagK/YfjJ domain-containing protein n=1 Tax=Pectobacterium polaris TaxID=2042057 RepID=UPI0020BF8EB1|nr:inovirus-type Gp2 protein [Pectobacterium polaris]